MTIQELHKVFVTVWVACMTWAIGERGKAFALGAFFLMLFALFIAALSYLPFILLVALLLLAVYFRAFVVSALYRYAQTIITLLNANTGANTSNEPEPEAVQYISTEAAAEMSGKSIATIRLRLSQFAETFTEKTGMPAIQYHGAKGERFINIQFVKQYIN